MHILTKFFLVILHSAIFLFFQVGTCFFVCNSILGSCFGVQKELGKTLFFLEIIQIWVRYLCFCCGGHKSQYSSTLSENALWISICPPLISAEFLLHTKTTTQNRLTHKKPDLYLKKKWRPFQYHRVRYAGKILSIFCIFYLFALKWL